MVKYPATRIFSHTTWPPLLGLPSGPSWAWKQEEWTLLFWSEATALGARKSAEEEEEQDKKLSVSGLL